MTTRFRVKLERGDHIIDAADDHDARMQTLQMLAEDPSLIRVEQAVMTFQWLVERGQPEGEERTLWLEHSGFHPASERCWTTEARDAALFPDRDQAEKYIADEGIEARAVEHGFGGWALV